MTFIQWLLLVAAAIFISMPASSQSVNPLDAYQKFWITSRGDTMPFRVLLPLNYDASKQYPLVFVLHGRGETGIDNERQLALGGRFFADSGNRKNFPAIVVFPQCPPIGYWSNVQALYTGSKQSRRQFFFQQEAPPSNAMQQAMELLDFVLRQYPVKKEQVYAMGISMGGMGCIEMVKRRPGLFAAAVPICGGGHAAWAGQLRNTAWWFFHGLLDDVVPPVHSQVLAEALRKQGATVKYSALPQANHNAWDSAFAERQLLPWLFAQRLRRL